MEKEVRKFLNKPVSPYLFGLYFILYKSSLYFAFFEIGSFIILLLWFCLLNFMAVKILTRILNIKYYNFSVLFFWITLLFLGPIFREIENIFPFLWIRHRSYLSVSVFIFAILLFLENRKWAQVFLKKLIPVINIFLIMSCVTSIFYGFLDLKQNSKVYQAAKYNNIKRKTDIVWILMDEYPSSASLKKYFNFENPLDTFLARKNYYLFNGVQSRTNSTLTSINSIFNYDDTLLCNNYLQTINKLESSSWVKDLSINKYLFKNIDFFKIGHNNNIDHLSLYPIDYFDGVIGETVFYLFMNNLFDSEDKYNNRAIKMLDSSLRIAPDSLFMVWTHLLIPHSPFARNKNKMFQTNPYVNLRLKESVFDGFLEYLQYGNTRIMEILNAHPELKNKIVIISGDHGIRFGFVDKADYFKPYCAIYMPEHYDTTELRKIKYISQIPDFIMKHLSVNN